MSAEGAAAVPELENPVEYHRLFRTSPNYAWWRPLVAALLFGAFALVATVTVSIVWMIIAIASGDLDLAGALSPHFQDELLAHLADTSNPLSLFLLLASIAVLLPLVPLAMLCAGLRPVSLRHSVAFRLRWRWMLWCLVPSLAITVVSIVVSLVAALLGGETAEPVAVDGGTFVLLAILTVLLVPFQSAAEEYIFRGLIMQTVGAWVRWVPLSIAVSTVLFTIGHTQYELWGLLSVGVMGLGFAIVAWRTGGLEAGIAFHTVNNVLAFLLLTSGITGTTKMGSEGSGPLALVTQLVFTAAFVFWIDRAAAKRGIARRRTLPDPPPVAGGVTEPAAPPPTY